MDPYMQVQDAPPPRKGHGCLFACLGTVIAIILVIVGVFSFGAWYFYKGFEHDARIQAIMQTVRNDPRAEAVLGKNIKALEVEVHTFDYSTGRGGTATYLLRVSGSLSEGELRVNLDLSDGGTKITLMVLKDKEGHEQYLKGAPPPNPLMDKSI